MSNLGKIYVVDKDRGTTESYPIVYENEDKYVCKIHGCTNIIVFHKKKGYLGFRIVCDIDEYKELLQLNDGFGSIYVYAPPHTHVNIQEIFNNSKSAIMRYLNTQQAKDRTTLGYYEENLKKCEESVEKVKESIQKVQKRLAEREKTIEQLRKEVEEDLKKIEEK